MKKHKSVSFMRKTLLIISVGLLPIYFFSCEKKEKDLSPQLAGTWQQEQIFVDDTPQILSPGELNTYFMMDANGVYRLFDGVKNQEHPGTWLFSDGDWLNLSMDKIQGQNKDGSYKFGQILVRFTILNVNVNDLELRIKTFLFERKLTVMFTLMDQDNTTGMTGEQLLALDTKNKQEHTYRYIFKKANL